MKNQPHNKIYKTELNKEKEVSCNATRNYLSFRITEEMAERLEKLAGEQEDIPKHVAKMALFKGAQEIASNKILAKKELQRYIQNSYYLRKQTYTIKLQFATDRMSLKVLTELSESTGVNISTIIRHALELGMECI